MAPFRPLATQTVTRILPQSKTRSLPQLRVLPSASVSQAGEDCVYMSSASAGSCDTGRVNIHEVHWGLKILLDLTEVDAFFFFLSFFLFFFPSNVCIE